jgi:hypothetical protein
MKARWLILAVSFAAAVLNANADSRFTVGISIGHRDDFYEPLRAHGHWVEVRPHGRCWYPAYIANDWRPYTEGHWVWTDGGWYWESDEPWAWATYHYGRWVWDSYYGWVWVPDTEWAPAWVAWREGDGYVGWAPLPPGCDYGPSGMIVLERVVWHPRAFVFVEPRRFCDTHHHRNVVINQTIINKTVNITRIERVENKTVIINNGPAVAVVEKTAPQPIRRVSVADLWRDRSERVVERATQDRVKPPPFVRTAPTVPTVEPKPVSPSDPTKPTRPAPVAPQFIPRDTTPRTPSAPYRPTVPMVDPRKVEPTPPPPPPNDPGPPMRSRPEPPPIIRGVPADDDKDNARDKRLPPVIRPRPDEPPKKESPAPDDQPRIYQWKKRELPRDDKDKEKERSTVTSTNTADTVDWRNRGNGRNWPKR